jgi:hypothetical protein
MTTTGGIGFITVAWSLGRVSSVRAITRDPLLNAFIHSNVSFQRQYISGLLEEQRYGGGTLL